MMAYTADEHVDQELLGARDAYVTFSYPRPLPTSSTRIQPPLFRFLPASYRIAGTSTSAKREYRKSYLPSEAVAKMPAEGADGWLSGRTIQLEAVERDVVPRPAGVRSKIDGTKEKA
jgi:hypothetical protein